jgi:hypothetical protein
MGWLKRLFEKFGWTFTRVSSEVPPIVYPEQMHCIRFMTEKGEQIGILLTTEEFERGINRWVDTIDQMPIETEDPNIEERIP